MTTDSESIFIDINILVYASIPTSPWHERSVEMLNGLESQGVENWISGQVLRELLVTLTRDDIRGSRSQADMIQQVLHFAGRFFIANDTPEVRRSLLDLIQQYGVQGKPIHDANIAATCLANGIPRLLTNNELDFKRFVSEIAIEPLQS